MFQVSPQFQTSVSAAAPARRGRRRCQSATSVLDGRNSVCKYPSLTFKSRLKNQPPQTQSTRKTAAQNSDAPKRRVRRGHAVRCSDGAASSGRCSLQPEAPSEPGPPPHVDTPDATRERSRSPSPGPLHALLHRSCSPCNQPPDVLVADTPERDYGLKVTWRRRKGLMARMKDGGHLSDADVLIHSSHSELAR